MYTQKRLVVALYVKNDVVRALRKTLFSSSLDAKEERALFGRERERRVSSLLSLLLSFFNNNTYVRRERERGENEIDVETRTERTVETMERIARDYCARFTREEEEEYDDD